MVARVKKNDVVVVISGKDKGKQGKVLVVSPKSNKILVKGVALATHFVKARRQGEVGGIKKEESYIHIAKVMPICSSCKKSCRVNVKMTEAGSRARTCNQCKAIF